MVNDLADPRPVYIIDALDRIVFVNPAWSRFMAPARGVGPSLSEVLGHPIWDRIPDGVVRQLWELLYSRVRAIGGSVFVPTRADRVDERRLIDIELTPLGDGSIRHVCEPVWSEDPAGGGAARPVLSARRAQPALLHVVPADPDPPGGLGGNRGRPADPVDPGGQHPAAPGARCVHHL